MTRDDLETLLEDAGAMLLEPRGVFDPAIIGYAERVGMQVAAYDTDKVILALMDQNDWDRDEAADWFEYNIAASFVGDASPVFVELVL